ncbi:hypothetical protein YM304_04950 [Ilumatobacter coccineus YM16-304]|uniref:Uncharacterized protein n=1 Tax=Ilumatobacter coccineus (strain NBRC 103263 / KCTC 29153 / YM16-304) TaxID=1313172 RepID=A0A6C7E6B9_ILUCY|nr:hypothetical protein YM304_04950 [Ilumatobacter coccineus YM16-304]
MTDSRSKTRHRRLCPSDPSPMTDSRGKTQHRGLSPGAEPSSRSALPLGSVTHDRSPVQNPTPLALPLRSVTDDGFPGQNPGGWGCRWV